MLKPSVQKINILGEDRMPVVNDSALTDLVIAMMRGAGSAEGEIFGFELLWVPDDDDEVLDMDEVMTAWPEVLTC